MLDDRFSCPPQYYDWDGYHAVPLKCYDEETAKCWHLGKGGV